jgi:aminoglycoside phosphotransferase family enzyme
MVARTTRSWPKRWWLVSKKTGLGENPLNWIKNTSQEVTTKKEPVSRNRKQGGDVQNFRTSELPKFKTFEVKLSILLRQDQLDFLEKTTREIMATRAGVTKKERITKNTILRAYIDAVKGFSVDIKNIPDETELLRRIREKIK